MDKIIKMLLKKYQAMFKDTIPLSYMNLSAKETVDLITTCLAKRQPFDESKYFPKGSVL